MTYSKLPKGYLMHEGDGLLDILSSKTVLYAEDEQSIRENITEILGLFFGEVISVEDGNEALYEMNLSPVDVLIFDICMPEIDGLEAIKEIRKTKPQIPAIILSAHTEQEYLWRAVELKITKYLTKPYDSSVFMDALGLVARELAGEHLIMKLSDNISYDQARKVIFQNNIPIQLSRQESRLLEFLIQKKNQNISFEEIFEYLWRYETPSKEAIKAIIKELRKKTDKNMICNVYGMGYRFELR